MSISNLTPSQLRQAADLKEKIEALNLDLEQITGNSGAVVPVAPKRGRPRKVASSVPAQIEEPKPGRRKGGMSAAGRARIAKAQKARWEVYNVGRAVIIKQQKARWAKIKSVETEGRAKKRTMTAAGRARIIAAQKLRWSKIKAAEGEAKPKSGKRTMSAAAKLAISKAAKTRWAKVRAAKKA